MISSGVIRGVAAAAGRVIESVAMSHFRYAKQQFLQKAAYAILAELFTRDFEVFGYDPDER